MVEIPPLTPVEEAIIHCSKAMALAAPHLKNLPRMSTDMTAQQARVIEQAADALGLASDCLAVVVSLRLRELKEAAND
ncbi:hypothetical protein GGQ88_003519 [Novosphingobium hassiacum]|uniref:Uncharacterized protein n=1 Tax=Novosphingobium hassiacum TaxID=173676 RepID=A0A7W5ZYB1_9SPHN|nr:hypothetical protein [Novosphingobium hassiacum]MBB3862221.1 hypothetical protein [Novosphingobium hassiacum]